MSDWITVTLAFKQEDVLVRIRRSAVISYGSKPWSAFIELPGKMIEVRESEAELAALLEDDVLSKV